MEYRFKERINLRKAEIKDIMDSEGIFYVKLLAI